jgi:hypothetical protein
VTGIDPPDQPLAGGRPVNISGVHFDLGVTSVSIGGVTTTGFTVLSPTRIDLTSVPPAPGGVPTHVDVRVNSPLGTSPATPDDVLWYTG